MPTSYLAFDLGATSCRAIVGTLDNGVMQMGEIHRFDTPIIDQDDHLYWDVRTLWAELVKGLDLALAETPDLRSLSVDSWAVDYVPLAGDGSIVRNPYCYRDPRTKRYVPEVQTKVDPRDLYKTTGIQELPFNTIYQVYADLKDEAELVERTSIRLLIADYFNYRFSGKPVVELSNASTTQLVDARHRAWSNWILESLGMEVRRFPIIVPSGTVYEGTPDSRSIPVVCGLTHDTACAVAAVPAEDLTSWIYLSSGTWSLLGAELQAPLLTDEAFEQSYTNELGLDGSVRFLKNMTGMWALEECIREWRASGLKTSIEDLVSGAEALGSASEVIDLDQPGFDERGEMEAKIRKTCVDNGITAPGSPVEVTRLILDSLAENYASKIEILSRMVALRGDTVLHIVGGGSRNTLLNQLTANATGLKVVAGPAESSALGNLLVQARSMGDLGEGPTIRDVARRSSEIVEFHPVEKSESKPIEPN